jgi:hypothetical protein
LHRLHRFYYYFGITGRANINFAAGAGKTVTACARNIEVGKPETTRFAGVKFFFPGRYHFKKYLINLNIPNMITRVKIMAAPDGISRKYEINNPDKVPVKAKTDDKISSFLKSLVNKFAEACGMVSNDKIRIIPTTLIFKTTVKAINDMVK